jgi:hypothetical protein
MDRTRSPPAESDNIESSVATQLRLASEADARNPVTANRRRQLTLEGLADVDAGRLIDNEAMRVWADSLGTVQELPVPRPG